MPKGNLQFCKNGHDILICGLTSDGNECRMCKNCNKNLGVYEDGDFMAKAGVYLTSKPVIFLNRDIDPLTEEEQ